MIYINTGTGCKCIFAIFLLFYNLQSTARATQTNNNNYVTSNYLYRLWNNILNMLVFTQRSVRQPSCSNDIYGCADTRKSDITDKHAAGLWFCTRENPHPVPPTYQYVKTANLNRLMRSGFNPRRRLKVLIHGYGGVYYSTPIIAAKDAFLKQDNVNVALVDWHHVSSEVSYIKTVMRAESVGIYISNILLSLVSLGTRPEDIHVIGFSLGAQIAGFIGEGFKQHGLKIGHITGLDPASFLFENAVLPTSRKLDHSDALFVEVLHTDASLMWSDGFGLLGSVGHADYFPNGGVNQPGCKDTYISALTFQLSKDKNAEGVCSHSRAWKLFLETIDSQSGCHFVGFHCPGLKNFDRDFVRGDCFPSETSFCSIPGNCALFGDSTARGIFYFMTRSSAPYCGEQLKASVYLSSNMSVTRGSLKLAVQLKAAIVTNFSLNTRSFDFLEGGREYSSMTVAKFGSIDTVNMPVLFAALYFTPANSLRSYGAQNIHFDRISLMTHNGYRWQFCNPNTLLEDDPANNSNFKTVQLVLSLYPCIT